MNSNDALSSGLRPLPTEITSFASTQAAWRFYKNDSVTLQKLQEPLLQAAHDNAVTHCKDYALIIHDWSRLNYRKHQSKLDKYQISHETDVGYDLQSSLLISDKTGLPLAPVALRLVTAKGSYSSYQNNALDESVASHLDEVTTCIDYLQQQAFAKPLVHIIDREADSIGHIRQWQENGYLWLTRAKDHTTVTFEKQTLTCPMIANRLSFNKIREVNYHGKSQWQWVAEAKIVITRHAHVRKNQKRTTVAGKPVEARLVVSRVMSDAGTILAQWVLITNVQGVDANKMQKWSAAKLDAYMRGKVAPVVVGPGNLVYLLDHHHLARVLADTKLSPTLYAVVKGSHAHLAALDFWKLMTEQQWVFLLDEAGHELKDPSQLPTAIRDMRDDPYRSLAWMVREQGGYNLSGAFFAEFQWANYFRHRIPFETTPAGYGQATAAALKISHDPAAKDLPGFIAP